MATKPASVRLPAEAIADLGQVAQGLSRREGGRPISQVEALCWALALTVAELGEAPGSQAAKVRRAIDLLEPVCRSLQKAELENPTAASPGAKPPTMDELRAAAASASARKGGAAVKSALTSQFKVGQLAELPESQRQAFLDAIAAL